MAREISSELTEPERRELVKAIADRGSRAYQVRDKATFPLKEAVRYSEERLKADPVDLGPAMEDLMAGVVDASGDAQRIAEAQRAIFGRSAVSDLKANERSLDIFGNQIEATNSELARYEEQLAAEEAARLASARRSGGGSRRRSGGGGGGSDLWIPGFDDAAEADTGYNLTGWQEERTMETYEQYNPAELAQIEGTIEGIITRGLETGSTWANVYWEVIDTLMGVGATREEAVNFLAPWAAANQGRFAGSGPPAASTPRSFGR